MSRLAALLPALGRMPGSPSQPIEVKLLAAIAGSAEVEADGRFSGYASLFGVPDLGRDIVEPGAFRASLARRGPAGVRLLWQHDPAEPIGRWLSLAEDTHGLRVSGLLNLGVARAREIHALMREGALDGLSIGYQVERARTDPRTGLRHLMAVDLWEVSVVTFPMLPGARVASVKAWPRAAHRDPLVAAITRAADSLRREAHGGPFRLPGSHP